jgi:predicted secreted protein
MAKPVTLPFSKLLILVGDGASPEVFASPCGLTSKGFDLTATSNGIEVPDCDDPDAPAWTDRVVKALSGTVSGSGILATESFEIWQDWALGGLPKNVRIKLDYPGLGYYSGSFILSKFGLKAALGDKVQVDVTLDSDGEITFTTVP